MASRHHWYLSMRTAPLRFAQNRLKPEQRALIAYSTLHTETFWLSSGPTNGRPKRPNKFAAGLSAHFSEIVPTRVR